MFLEHFGNVLGHIVPDMLPAREKCSKNIPWKCSGEMFRAGAFNVPGRCLFERERAAPGRGGTLVTEEGQARSTCSRTPCCAVLTPKRF